ncbi:MAG: hypothetical protein JXR78_06520 [Victivallales bacterium]|nr:hypothetical protein [Victivallales bacterium]
MKTFSVLSLTLLVTLLTGCGTTAKFVYPGRMADLIRFQESAAINKKVAVLPFDDYRNDSNTSGTMALYALPLMPWGWVDYDRPDAARLFVSIHSFDFNASEDLAKAAALSLRRSNLFEDAYFTFGGEKDTADYIFTGRVYSTNYEGTIYSYGISIACPYLWLIGLPVGSSWNTLDVKFELHDKTSKKLLWEYVFQRRAKTVQGLYYHRGHDVLQYPYLMQAAMNEALQDMSSKLRSLKK